MRIAFVSARVPYPLNTGGRIRTYHLLKAVAERHDVTLVTSIETRGDARSLEKLGDALPAIRMHVSRVRRRGALAPRLRRAVLSPFDPLPFAWAGFRDPRYMANVAAALRHAEYDLVHCDHVQVAHALPARGGVPRLIDAHNVENVLVERLAEHEARRWRRPLMSWQAFKTRRAEQATYAGFDRCVAVSEIDRARIEALAPGVPVSLVPNGVDVKAFTVSPAPVDPNLIVFVGSMDWPPNVQGVTWFVRDVLPEIRRRRPAARVLVVGRRPPRALVRALASTHVRFTGTVEDVRPFVEQAGVVIVPLLSGGGTRLKILEAWAMGKPIVSTSVGAEGLPGVHGINLMLADAPGGFAGCVTDLIDDEPARGRLAAAGRTLVEERFAWERVGELLLAAYAETCR